MDAPAIGRIDRDELFRSLVEHVKDYAIFLLDPNGRVMSWNEGAERIKGYSEEEIVGRHFSVFYPAGEVERGHPEQVLRQALAEGRYEEEAWRVRKDGSMFWASVVITAIRSETDDELIGFAKITRDLTERKRVEEERAAFLRHERAARQEAEAALAELRAARRETAVAEEAIRARDEFLSIAAHELKTPLTGVKAAAQLLARRAARAGDLDPSLSSALEIVERQVDKLAMLVTHLFEAVRIQADKVSLDLAPADLVAIVREAVAPIAAATGRRIDVSGPASLTATVDALRLEQVITNLVDNAAKYSQIDPIEVTIARRDERTAEITVRDRGQGVPSDQRSHLFERYFQAHADRSGMGLGLYISRVIAEEHGGGLTADFPPDGGSRFTIALPLGEHGAEDLPKPSAP